MLPYKEAGGGEMTRQKSRLPMVKKVEIFSRPLQKYTACPLIGLIVGTVISN